MRRSPPALLAAALIATAAPAQDDAADAPAHYAVAVVDRPSAAEMAEAGLVRPDFDASQAMMAAVDANLQFDAFARDVAWQLAGPFDTREEAGDALDWDAWRATAAAENRDAPLSRMMDLSSVEERFTATVSTLSDDAPADGAGADANAPLAFFRLWRLTFHDGAEERGADIVQDRFAPAMASIGREVVIVRPEGETEWDLMVFQGPFANVAEAAPQYDVELEEALIDRINDPRIVMALKAELGALTLAEEERVVYRHRAGK